MVFGGLIGSPQDIQRSFQLVQCLNMPYKAPDTPLRKKSVEMSSRKRARIRSRSACSKQVAPLEVAEAE
jgi:hypothetical protein